MWPSVALFGPVWHCVSLCGTVWHFVALCGTVWHCVALCGTVWQAESQFAEETDNLPALVIPHYIRWGIEIRITTIVALGCIRNITYFSMEVESFSHFFISFHSWHPELRFVTTVATGGRVKLLPAVSIFPENNAFSCKICVEVKDLRSPSVNLHWILHTQLNYNKNYLNYWY